MNHQDLPSAPNSSPILESPQRCAIHSMFLPGGKQKFPLQQKVSAFGYDWVYADSIRDLEAFWNSCDNIYLQVPYLQALEQADTNGLTFRYLLAFKAGKPVGGITMQLLKVSAAHSIRTLRNGDINGFWDQVRWWLAKWGSYRFMIWGNMFLTGQYNQWWDIAEPELPLLKGATLKVLQELAKQEKIQILMARDCINQDDLLEKAGFHAIDFQPNMVMDIPSAWKSFDDYLNSMSSKYRVRARRAFKKSDGILFKELDLRQIELFKEDLNALYLSVVEQADFNMLWAGKNYFLQLKEKLGPNLSLFGCFEKDRLLGFYTTIRNGKELDANFLGFDQEANREHQLYLSILYRIVEQAINQRCEKVYLARTALEIKSSIGAVGQKTYVYLKHTNPLLNWVLPTAVRFGEPKEEWVPRHPFREE